MRMSLSVCQVLESVENEEGRFRTLRDVVFVTDRSGHPVFTVSGRMISFPVSWQRCGYVLTCLLDRDHERFIRYSRIAEIIAQRSRKSTCLVDYRYLSQELLVFDDLGQSRYTDVVLMEMPRGAKRLDTVFDELCREDNREKLHELLREFCRMAVLWIDSGLVHGSLAPKNIIQLSDGTLRLIHYERLQVLSKESENITAQHTDLVMLANMALALKTMIACPEIYRTLKGDPMFQRPVCSSFLPTLLEAAERAGCLSVQKIIALIDPCNKTVRDRYALRGALLQLMEDGTELDARVLQRFGSERRDVSSKVPESIPAESAAPRMINRALLEERYDWVGPVCEAMICVSKNDRWGYLDYTGKEVIALHYDWADDFAEGRACVLLEGHYGLIGKTGEEILPPAYEEIEWNCHFGTVKASCDGCFGLFDRNGACVVPLIYHSMGSIDNELIAVGLENRFGYIRHDGTVVIPLMYDEAYDFQNGKAVVVQNGRYLEIDSSGAILREAVEYGIPEKVYS